MKLENKRLVTPKKYFMDEFEVYYGKTKQQQQQHRRRRGAIVKRRGGRRVNISRRVAKKINSNVVKKVSRQLNGNGNRVAAVRNRVIPIPVPAFRNVIAAPLQNNVPIANVIPNQPNQIVQPIPIANPIPVANPNPFLGDFEPIPQELLDTSAWEASKDPEEGIFRFPASLTQENQEQPKVEICFSLDTTGSMSNYVDAIKEQIENLIRQLTSDLPEIRIGIMAHGDYCDYKVFVLKRLDLSNQVSSICDFVRSLEGTFGGDKEECYELVLKEAQNLAWTPETAKALVLVGDSCPHSPNEYLKIDWKVEAEKLKALGVRVYGVRCGNTKDTFFNEISEMTGGTTLDIQRFNELNEIVMGLCYLEASENHAKEREFFERNFVPNPNASNSSSSSSNPETVIELPEHVENLEQVNEQNSNEMEIEERGPIKIDEGDAMHIHEAIHWNYPDVVIQGKTYPIAVGKAGCRFVTIGGQTFIEQNKDKVGSKYAQMAIEGKKITWIIKRGKWGLIMGERQMEVNQAIAKEQSGAA